MDLVANATLTGNLGVYVQPGIGEAYPELVKILRELYRTRVSRLPFVPNDWYVQVDRLMGSNTVVKLQQSKPNGVVYDGLPVWIVSDKAAIDAWQKVAVLMNSAITAFIGGEIEKGKSIIASANANAEFWNTLYDGAVWVRDAPGKAVDAVGRGAMSFAGSFLAKTWWIGAVLLVGLFIYVNRGAAVAAAGKKLKV